MSEQEIQKPRWLCPTGHWEGDQPAKTWNGYIPSEACPVCGGAVVEGNK